MQRVWQEASFNMCSGVHLSVILQDTAKREADWQIGPTGQWQHFDLKLNFVTLTVNCHKKGTWEETKNYQETVKKSKLGTGIVIGIWK